MTRYGKEPRYYELNQPMLNKRFYKQEFRMGNKDRVSKKNSQGGLYTFERHRSTSCGKQHFGRSLASIDGFF